MSLWEKILDRGTGETVRKEDRCSVYFEVEKTDCSHCYNDDFGPGEDIVLNLRNQEEEIIGIELYVEGEEYTDGNGLKFLNIVLDKLKKEYNNLFFEVTYDEEGEAVYHMTKIVRDMLIEFVKRMKDNQIYVLGIFCEYGMYDELGNYIEDGRMDIKQFMV